MKHTATPWQQNADYIMANGVVIAKAYDKCLVGPDVQANADSEFIVRAVNSHDALVEALRDALVLILDNGIDECDQYENGRDLLAALAEEENAK